MTPLRKLASLCRAEFREHRTDMRDPLSVSAAIWRVIDREYPRAGDGERAAIEAQVMGEMMGSKAA